MKTDLDLLKQYLSDKRIPYWEKNGELITHCLINDCDRDSKGEEAHFYVSQNTCQYDCKKCGEKGNIITLAKLLKEKGDIYLSDELIKGKKPSNPRFSTLVEKCHKALPVEVRTYLREKRGLTDEVIDQYKIGWFNYIGTWWITFPIKDEEGKYRFFKLRQDPKLGKEKRLYPAGNEAQLYDYEGLNFSAEKIVIAEGEGDRLLLVSRGIVAITNTAGAGTFKDEWLPLMPKDKTYYIAYDNDEAGKKGAEKVASKLYNYGIEKIYIVELPVRPWAPEDKVDITDYLMDPEINGSIESIFGEHAHKYPKPIDTSRFKELRSGDLDRILSLTIKEDSANKIATFCTMINAYTDDAQINISFNGPSSAGKSHTALEVAKYFPEEDRIELMSASPTAFFHENGIYDKERNVITVDLSRKIIIFLDMPHSILLKNLRPLLSHDKKVLQTKITDKSQKGGNRTKTVEIIGFPSVIFCTASLDIDEQEATRMLLLSPEMTQSKLKQGIQQSIHKATNRKEFENALDQNEERQLLMERIRAIKQEKVFDVRVENEAVFWERFITDKKQYKPKHQRDVKRVVELAKSFALLNFCFRGREGSTIIASDSDIEEAFKLWEKISVSQELGIPPFIHNLFLEVIVPAYKEKVALKEQEDFDDKLLVGLTRKEIRKKHWEAYGRQINMHLLREQILPMLETAGLIEQEQDGADKRQVLVFPVFEGVEESQGNSTESSGVEQHNTEMIFNSLP